MKNTKSVEPDAGAEGGMQDEHSFDYNKAKPNCFEGKIGQNQLMVCRDAAFAAVFKATESVNHVLWAIITSFPTTEKRQLIVALCFALLVLSFAILDGNISMIRRCHIENQPTSISRC